MNLKEKVTGVIIFKITDGKIVETRAEMDALGWMQQLDVISVKG